MMKKKSRTLKIPLFPCAIFLTFIINKVDAVTKQWAVLDRGPVPAAASGAAAETVHSDQ